VQSQDSLASSAECRCVRRQPGSHASQLMLLIWPSEPAKWVQSRPLVVQVRLLVEKHRGHPVTTHLVSSMISLNPTPILFSLCSVTPIYTADKHLSAGAPTALLCFELQRNLKSIHLRGVYVSWRERVDPYPLGSKFTRHAPGHL
jgi:hypothetical protein